VTAVSCGIKISVVHHLVLSEHTRLTDGRTDGQMNRQTDRTATAILCVAAVALHAAWQEVLLAPL